MSADVMYQPYSTSFGYQRNTDHSLQSLCIPKTQEPLDLGIYPSHSNSLGHTLTSSSLDHHGVSLGLSHMAGLGHTTGGTPTNSGHNPGHNTGHNPGHNTGHNPGPNPGHTTVLQGIKEEEKSEQPKDIQFLSANCVLMTYYSGDISAAVENHFARARSQPSSFSPEGKHSRDPSLMSQRKFPPSFWNSNYYSPGYSDFQFPPGHYSPSSIPSFSSLQDPWFSRLSSQSHTFHHRPVHYDFPYPSMGAGRYNSNIGSLLLQSARSGHFPGSDYGKSTESKFRYPDYRFGADYHGQNVFPGLEPSATETTPGRDLYLY